ncbi:S1 family peptidase [Anatilimnocola floriformis]|uniref:S1 family peptidase n=1 Tax=Anatilimnocola floriformis TaxID=2948575 RepID=UPI0020C35C89|nr:S1 family peptidase [Anatilimnocola floriformis]
MPSFEDLLAAKKTLSGTLLRAGLQGGVMGMMKSFSTTEAVTSASHNVHSIGIGRKWVDGKPTETLCVRIFVVQKLPLSMLAPFQLLRKSIEGIETDVVEAPPAFASAKKRKASSPKADKKATKKSAPPRKPPPPIAFDADASDPSGGSPNGRGLHRNPLVAGVSAGHFKATGTLGYFCRSLKVGEGSDVFVLSNNHVFANANDSQKDDDLVQPGIIDGGSLGSSHFAELHRSVPLKMGGTSLNFVDAAIGKLLTGIAFEPEILTIGKVHGAALADTGMRVCKHGRTSGYTEGVITDLAIDALVGMDHNDPSIVAKFEDQIRIVPATPFTSFAEPGDSGSLILKHSNKAAVGLHFAGANDGSYGLANHMSHVLKELDIALL